MTDIYDSVSAKRLFGAIAAGGSIGAMTGPIDHGGAGEAEWAFPICCSFPLHATGHVDCLHRGFGPLGQGASGRARSRWQCRRMADDSAERAIGGGVLDGIKLAFASPYLLAICGYIFHVAGHRARTSIWSKCG